ncbi:hypothetical protein GCM10022631_02970 [Deinococcus rubellus]
MKVRVGQNEQMERRPYPSDIDEDTYHFMVPYLVLTPEHAAQRKYPLKEGLNALFWMTRTGAQWEFLPHDFPPPRIVQEHAQRWFDAGVFEAMAHDLRILSRVQKRRSGDPSAIIIDRRTLQSGQALYGCRSAQDARLNVATVPGTTVPKSARGPRSTELSVDTLGHLLAVLTSPANE